MIQKLKKFYYWATAYIPRKLPTTEDEFLKLKYILRVYMGVEDMHQSWMTVCGHITSTEATKLRKSYIKFANAAKRMQINAIAQEQKMKMHAELQKKLTDTMERVVQSMNEEEKKNEQEVKEQPQTHDEPKQQEAEIQTQEQGPYEQVDAIGISG